MESHHLGRFAALLLILNCVFLVAWATTESGTATAWKGLGSFSTANQSPPTLAHFKGQCVLSCQHDAACIGILYDDVNKNCVHVTTELAGDASPGFRYYSDKWICPRAMHPSCVMIFKVDKTWPEALDACDHMGGRLVVLDTREKMVSVLGILNDSTAYPTGQFHLGAQRPQAKWNTSWPITGQDFHWLNGQPLDKTIGDPYWLGSNPNNFQTNENILKTQRKSGVIWLNDFKENSSQGYVCEYLPA